MNIIAKMKFGSHLYGTDNPKSDFDYKGVFLPTYRDLLLGTVRKSVDLSTNKTSEKNDENDVDEIYYSLPYFIKLLCDGEIGAIDMMHARDDSLLITSDIWEELYLLRENSYSKSLNCFMGYAKNQAAKYGIRGSRLDFCKKVIEMLNKFPENTKLKTIWDKLPLNEEFATMEERLVNPGPDQITEYFYRIIGKNFSQTSNNTQVIKSLSKFVDSYGHRAELAKNNEGIDWKALSHCVRASLQLLEIYQTEDLKFPLKDRELIKEIKSGSKDYTTEVAPLIERLIDEVQTEVNKCKLPIKVNREFYDNWLFKTLDENKV